MNIKQEIKEELSKAKNKTELKLVLMKINMSCDVKGHKSLMNNLLTKDYYTERDLKSYASCFIKEYM